MLFDVCNLDFDPITLVLKLDIDIMVTYWYTKMMSIGHLVQKVWSGNADRQTDTHTCVKQLPIRSCGRQQRLYLSSKFNS